jgi:hypothetical protein
MLEKITWLCDELLDSPVKKKKQFSSFWNWFFLCDFNMFVDLV